MSALNVFLAIVGVGVTALVVAGMVLLKPHHLVSAAVQTDLSDVEPKTADRAATTRPAVADRRTRVQPTEHS